MGMYTEINLRIRLKEDVPENVISTINDMVNGNSLSNAPEHPFFKTPRCGSVMLSSSFYHVPFATMCLRKKSPSTTWYLFGRSDLKNYNDEIELFFDWIYPYCREGMLGYSLYEEEVYPDVYVKQDGKLLRNRAVVSEL